MTPWKEHENEKSDNACNVMNRYKDIHCTCHYYNKQFESGKVKPFVN